MIPYPRTVARDRQILKLFWEDHKEPKEIAIELNLSSVTIVYETFRRLKRLTKTIQKKPKDTRNLLPD